MINIISINDYKNTPNENDLSIIVNLTVDFGEGEEEISFVYRDGMTGNIADAIKNDILENSPVILDADVYTPTVDDYTLAIEDFVDSVAVEKKYTNGVSITTYINSTNADWALEAQTFIAWRDTVWLYTYEQLDLVTAGERTAPTIAEFIEELPKIEWPN